MCQVPQYRALNLSGPQDSFGSDSDRYCPYFTPTWTVRRNDSSYHPFASINIDIAQHNPFVGMPPLHLIPAQFFACQLGSSYFVLHSSSITTPHKSSNFCEDLQRLLLQKLVDSGTRQIDPRHSDVGNTGSRRCMSEKSNGWFRHATVTSNTTQSRLVISSPRLVIRLVCVASGTSACRRRRRSGV